MDGVLRDKERELERLGVDEQIASRKASIAEKKRLERGAREGEGKDWKKVLGVVKGLKPDKEVIQDLYLAGGDLKEYSRPSRLRRL